MDLGIFLSKPRLILFENFSSPGHVLIVPWFSWCCVFRYVVNMRTGVFILPSHDTLLKMTLRLLIVTESELNKGVNTYAIAILFMMNNFMKCIDIDIFSFFFNIVGYFV